MDYKELKNTIDSLSSQIRGKDNDTQNGILFHIIGWMKGTCEYNSWNVIDKKEGFSAFIEGFKDAIEYCEDEIWGTPELSEEEMNELYSDIKPDELLKSLKEEGF